MKIKILLILAILAGKNSFSQNQKNFPENKVLITSAMRQVMWEGKLDAQIQLDSLAGEKGLYGIGPLSGLQGEILLQDGHCYVSKVIGPAEMRVFEDPKAGAPFFVYAKVLAWEEFSVPDSIQNLEMLEIYVDELSRNRPRPFAFRLNGLAREADIHIQNLPEGARVSSPDEAHAGQVNYLLTNESVEITGFFSTEHKAVFTHHDTYMHLHLITADKSKMGHLDALTPGSMKLYLPASLPLFPAEQK